MSMPFHLPAKYVVVIISAVLILFGGVSWYLLRHSSVTRPDTTKQTTQVTGQTQKTSSDSQKTVTPTTPSPTTTATTPTATQPKATQPANSVPKTSTPSSTPTPTPTPTPTKTYSCVTSVLPHGTCGPYPGYAYITGVDGDPYVDQNVWSGGASYKQTISANSPGDWKVVANADTNFGGVQSFPNTGWGMPWPERALDTYSSITSSWDVTIPSNPETVGWAAYDLWFNSWADEVMIQTDIQANSYYNCTGVVTATFSSGTWHMCQFGNERVWKHGTDDNHLINQPSGGLNVREILVWMEQNGYLPASSTWTAGSFGFEICDTGGLDATFTVNAFAWSSL